MARQPKDAPKEPTRGDDGPSERSTEKAQVACIMGGPVDPDDGFPPERVKSLRAQTEAIMARGSMVMVPTSINDFDLHEFDEDG
jgi:hypothetical protein